MIGALFGAALGIAIEGGYYYGKQQVAPTYTEEQVKCLADNMYFEARGEGIDGMMMIADVTINRVKDHRFPKEICAVVYQKGPQFSWTVNKKRKIADIETYEIAYDIAEDVLAGEADLINSGALFFKAKGHRSKFHDSRTKIGAVGNHEFYK